MPLQAQWLPPERGESPAVVEGPFYMFGFKMSKYRAGGRMKK